MSGGASFPVFAVLLVCENAGVGSSTLGVDPQAIAGAPLGEFVGIEVEALQRASFGNKGVNLGASRGNILVKGWLDLVGTDFDEPKVIFACRPQDADELRSHFDIAFPIVSSAQTVANAGGVSSHAPGGAA